MTNEQETRTGGLFKELVIMFGLIGLLVTLLTGVGALYWMQSLPGTAAAGTPAAARPAESARPKTTAPAPDVPVLHADVYFDFKSVRLSADAARMLQGNAAVMTRTEAWAVLVTGYAEPTASRLHRFSDRPSSGPRGRGSGSRGGRDD